ncbi:hypothetical protein V3C99_008086 [Haemonchus contortus]|uniref:Uncharacterized protein n=1 Tax=Haemonchus contortus TaxID=6289 RepID=A0A7I4Z2H7_HAECO
MTLYNKILHESIQLRIATRSMSDLLERIKALQHSHEDFRNRSLQLHATETLWKKIHTVFALLRSEIRTLSAVIPLLQASGMLSEEEWNLMIQKPQWDDRGETLLLNHDEIERVIKDQFEIL